MREEVVLFMSLEKLLSRQSGGTACMVNACELPWLLLMWVVIIVFHVPACACSVAATSNLSLVSTSK